MRRVLIFLLVVSCASPCLMAQAASADEQETLEAILTELRGLREDMRTTSLLTAKLQLASLRVGIQEERVARASDALAQVQSDLNAEVQLRSQLRERARQLQAEFDTTGGSDERRAITAQLNEARARAANGLIEGGLRAREVDAMAQLESAQEDLLRVQNQLADVERSIDRAPGR